MIEKATSAVQKSVKTFPVGIETSRASNPHFHPWLPVAAVDPQICRLAPTVKHTGQESVNCAKFSNFDRFCIQNV